MNTTWFGLDGVQIAAAVITPRITEPGLDTVDGELVTRLGHWSVWIEIDNGFLGDYTALVQNFSRHVLLFPMDKTYRRGCATLISAMYLSSTRLRLEWRGEGTLR